MRGRDLQTGKFTKNVVIAKVRFIDYPEIGWEICIKTTVEEAYALGAKAGLSREQIDKTFEEAIDYIRTSAEKEGYGLSVEVIRFYKCGGEV